MKKIFSKFPNFSECTENNHCKETNKGLCNADTNLCVCNEGFVLSGDKCVGMLPIEIYIY